MKIKHTVQIFGKGIGAIKSFAKALALSSLLQRYWRYQIFGKGIGTIKSLAKATALKILANLLLFEQLKCS